MSTPGPVDNGHGFAYIWFAIDDITPINDHGRNLLDPNAPCVSYTLLSRYKIVLEAFPFWTGQIALYVHRCLSGVRWQVSGQLFLEALLLIEEDKSDASRLCHWVGLIGDHPGFAVGKC